MLRETDKSVVKVGFNLGLPEVGIHGSFLGQEKGCIVSLLSDAKPGGEYTEGLGEAGCERLVEEGHLVGRVKLVLVRIG